MKKKQNKPIKNALKQQFSYEILYTIDKIASLKPFNSLGELRLFGKENNLVIDNCIVYRINKFTNKKIAIPKSKYAYINKIFNNAKSTDNTGFFNEYSWVKTSPFEQPPIVPLPSSFTEKHQPIVIEAPMPKKNFFKKMLDLFKNTFMIK